jgi:hypothetical protein
MPPPSHDPEYYHLSFVGYKLQILHEIRLEKRLDMEAQKLILLGKSLIRVSSGEEGL